MLICDVLNKLRRLGYTDDEIDVVYEQAVLVSPDSGREAREGILLYLLQEERMRWYDRFQEGERPYWHQRGFWEGV